MMTPDSPNSHPAQFLTGQEVVLVVPNNPQVHGARAIIRRLEDWGAHVLTDSTATGQFRALFSEMSLTNPVVCPFGPHPSGVIARDVECVNDLVRGEPDRPDGDVVT